MLNSSDEFTFDVVQIIYEGNNKLCLQKKVR